MLISLLLLALTPQQASIRALADADLRVAAIGDRLARAGTPFCPGQATSLGGLVVQDLRQYAPALRADVRAVLGMGEGVSVAGALPDVAGVVPGSPVMAVDGMLVATGAKDSYADVARAEELIETGLQRGPVRLTFGGGATLTLAPRPGCKSRFQIVRGGFGKTQADGRYVQLSEKMLNFAASDDEAAAVLAHELAHNILGHRAKRTPSKRAEYESDWLSVWLVARAGFNPDAIVPFWTRLGRRTDYGIFADGSHPGWRKRVARLAEAVALVKTQREAGQALIP